MTFLACKAENQYQESIRSVHVLFGHHDKFLTRFDE